MVKMTLYGCVKPSEVNERKCLNNAGFEKGTIKIILTSMNCKLKS